MNRFSAITVSAAALALVVLNGGAASASGSTSGAWPTAYPLPTSPGTVLSQSATSAVVRSTDRVVVVKSKLDNLYVGQLGCTEKLTVNKPKDYFCVNAATGKTEEIFFTFAALDPTATDPSVSQTNAFRGKS